MYTYELNKHYAYVYTCTQYSSHAVSNPTM